MTWAVVRAKQEVPSTALAAASLHTDKAGASGQVNSGGQALSPGLRACDQK